MKETYEREVRWFGLLEYIENIIIQPKEVIGITGSSIPIPQKKLI